MQQISDDPRFIVTIERREGVDLERLLPLMPISIPDPVRDLLTVAGGTVIQYLSPMNNSEIKIDIERVFGYKQRLMGGVHICRPTEVLDALNARHEWVGAHNENSELWMVTVPFLFIPNGDSIGIRIDRGQRQAVVYLNHDGNSFELSPSLPEFLAFWESICYVGPGWWLLESWYEDYGLLRPNPEKAGMLAEIFQKKNTGL